MPRDTLPPDLDGGRIRTLFPHLPSLIGSDSVIGAPVYDERECRVGTVEQVLIEKLSGRIYHAVLSFHRIRALRGRQHRVPWILLRYDEELGGFRVNISKMRADVNAIRLRVEEEADHEPPPAIESPNVLRMSDFIAPGMRPQ